MGTAEFGYILRTDGHDDEDEKYQKHVQAKTGDKSWRVVDGTLYKV